MPDKPNRAKAAERGSGASDPQALMGLLRRYAVEVDRYIETHGSRRALHRTDLNALAVIMDAARAGDPMSPGRLSKALRLSSPATSALLDRLERAGHVERHRSPDDRRRVELEMTDQAAAVGSELFGTLGRHVGAAIGRYSDEERELVARFLRDVIDATARAGAPAEVTETRPVPPDAADG